eukprot:Lithocolla_globosa_v1_NODE_2978_length_1805_cov_12.398286.p5 type:complete len:120 gc:universal NODE_2978_length_1805_cov_12.398286:135-494(+)
MDRCIFLSINHIRGWIFFFGLIGTRRNQHIVIKRGQIQARPTKARRILNHTVLVVTLPPATGRLAGDREHKLLQTGVGLALLLAPFSETILFVCGVRKTDQTDARQGDIIIIFYVWIGH